VVNRNKPHPFILDGHRSRRIRKGWIAERYIWFDSVIDWSTQSKRNWIKGWKNNLGKIRCL